jgi:SAM-dependent MidA family methyltransferase
MRDELRNLLQYGGLTFRDFMELALYHPQAGYYSRAVNPVGKMADYVTAPSLSPAFSYAIANLFREFVRRHEGVVCSFVDIGCGDGGLIRGVRSSSGFLGVPRSSSEGGPHSEEPEELRGTRGTPPVRFFGVDRSLDRAHGEGITFVRSLDEVPRDGAHLLFSNELYDAFPFARLVQRGEHLHELWVSERDGHLDWSEHEAAPVYDDYFAERGIELAEGQFADLSLEWEAYHEDVLRFSERALLVTIDYGYAQAKLFHSRARRFGTAAAYSGQQVHRDLLANPGEQDLTAHINFTDLERAGSRQGAETLFFDVLAKFLLAVGITRHELFRPVQDVGIGSAEEGLELIQAREDARRLVLPDGLGVEQRVLVQARNVPRDGWSFQERLF